MCTNIVTNSYSCGIGEQNLNALMMDYQKIHTMEVIKKEEMSLILGGYDAEECKRVQGSITEDMSEEDWAKWEKDFYKYCI